MGTLLSLYQLLGFDGPLNWGHLFVVSALVFLLLVSLAQVVQAMRDRKKLPSRLNKKKPNQATSPSTPTVNWKSRLGQGLQKSRLEVWGRVYTILKDPIKNIDFEQIEELLYTSDMSPRTIDELLETLKGKLRQGQITPQQLNDYVYHFLKNKMAPVQNKIEGDLLLFPHSQSPSTRVVMIVGVNGAGKTTTIGKLATKLRSQGAKVVVGACDTFRAAAVEQLEVWCQRAGAEMVRAKEGGDPSGVAYDALAKAQALKADYCLLDTAGRLHTKANLMDELAKTKRVLAKLDPQAPHETLLVIDAITGQNALKQAQEFNQALKLSGLIFTKCDGSSKAGSGVSIVDTLKVPIAYIGVGEEVEDLNKFDLDEYLVALVGRGDESNMTYID